MLPASRRSAPRSSSTACSAASRRRWRQGEKVELRGFGSFRLRHRGPHSARNPRTGALVDVPSKRIAYFKAGKELKELINRELAQAGPPNVILSRVDVRCRSWLPSPPNRPHAGVGLRRRRRRWSLPGRALAGKVDFPIVHEAPPLEQVRLRVGRLDLVAGRCGRAPPR